MEPAPIRKYWQGVYKCGCVKSSPVYTRFPRECAEHKKPLLRDMEVTEYDDPEIRRRRGK